MLRAMSQPTDVVLDRAVAYPQIPALRAALARRDWPACRALLDSAGPMERTGLIRAVCEDEGLEGFLRDVLAAGAAGFASAALALWAMRGLPLGTGLFWITAFPLFAAGLGFGRALFA